MNSLKKIIYLLIAIFVFLQQAYSDSFRVRKVECIALSGNSLEEKNVEIGINDAIAIFLPNDKTYLDGVELIIQIPKIVADWRDSVAFSIYDNISPSPVPSQIDYSGNKIFVTTIPQKMNWIVHIPLTENNSIKESNYVSKINVLPDTSKNYTFFRFQPAMKGVPDETYEAKFNITVKPVLKNIGTLKLSAKNQEGEEVFGNIFIDEKQVALKGGKINLIPGVHTISVQCDGYRNEVQSVVIDQAKITSVEVNLRSNEPTVKITAPNNTQIFLDDQPFTKTDKEIAISDGDHTIRCIFGGYEITRALKIQKGKSYSINLLVDLEISEE